jgi:hypothetical protein
MQIPEARTTDGDRNSEISFDSNLIIKIRLNGSLSWRSPDRIVAQGGYKSQVESSITVKCFIGAKSKPKEGVKCSYRYILHPS